VNVALNAAAPLVGRSRAHSHCQVPSGLSTSFYWPTAHFAATESFPAPEAFDVARADNAHMTFGHGPHYCIGAPLARIELQTLFGMLFRRFPTLRLAAPTEQLRPRSHLLTGGLTTLPVTW